jgi:hypothetical protein
MTIDEILLQFSRDDCVLPREPMQWSLDHWDEVAPSFIHALNDPSIGPGHPNDPRFFIVHLLGEKKELRAHAEICRMILAEPGELEFILGGTTTDGLCRILISTFSGDPAPLLKVIEDEHADQYARSQALDALTYVYADGRLPAFDMRSTILALGQDLQPKACSYVWTAWAEAVARLGYDELVETYRCRAREGLIDPFSLRPSEFDELLAMSKDRGPMAVFVHDRICPYGRAIETLETWHAFSEEAQARAAAQVSETADDGPDDDFEYCLREPPAVNPQRKVGRNDPCPCGSGKKFKKCCLGSAK